MFCFACTSPINTHKVSSDGESVIFNCSICGMFELELKKMQEFNRNHLASFLTYHAFKIDPDRMTEFRYHSTRSQEYCNEYRENLKNKNLHSPYPVHMDNNMIEAWYPKNFSERVDYILLYIASHTQHLGQSLYISNICLSNVLFVDVQEINTHKDLPQWQWIIRDAKECIQEIEYMLSYLQQQNYIEADHFMVRNGYRITLLPKGYTRVEELQRYSSYGRSVLVAMKFGEETSSLREAIRKGVTDAGYIPVFIDEVQHNDFITPELLKHIRDSKFVVVDLTHKNNGAYFEEGYAMGLGKPVIQLCKIGIPLHFDIAQKNTVMWETEDDVPEKLCKRIKATIE